MLRPMLLFAVVIAIIANFQVFDTVYVLTQGGPYQSTSTMVWFIWKRLFQFQQTGQGYAAAVLLLGIILVPDGDLVLAAGVAATPRAGRPDGHTRSDARPGRAARKPTPDYAGAARREPRFRVGKGIAAYRCSRCLR